MSACLLDDPRFQLVELEAEICRVEALLSKLAHRRVPLKRKINRRFSPMLSLPVELCSEIFTSFCAPAGSDSPLLLGQVCSAWRNLAWSMPWLWTNIHLCSTCPRDVHVQLLEEWIARSAKLPLSIHLKVQLGSPDVNMRDVTHIMDAVARCSQRWRTVNFDVPFFYPADSYMSHLGPSNFPMLTSATIEVKHFYTPLDMFVGAPSLQNVHLVGFPRNSFELSWHNITSLRLNPTTIQQCIEVLNLAQNLTNCVFENITRSDVLDPTPVVAPNLQSLEIISFTHTPISELLDTLFLPSALDLSFHITGNAFPQWSFISLIVRSNCTLRRLTLNAVRISDWQLWDCLREVPSLLELHIIDLTRITKDTIRALNPLKQPMLGPQHTAPLLPLLREFTYIGAIELDFYVIANTAHARWAGTGVMKMEKMRLETSAPAVFGPEEMAHLARLRALAEQGMGIELITRDGAWI
ncbi:hypothetical protein C0993_009566 [Termitomyces sp. T159_Od127]|nr:hypothetical protein C0993_009566 [Termitomyces sp. T159_Od127]